MIGALIALTAAGRARANDPDRAARLFQEGREAMNAGDYARACERFTASESADPHVGTLINLAQCEEALVKTAASRQYWQQALDLARATVDPRIAYIEQQLARIDARVARLTVRLAPTAPPDTVARRDGVDFAAASFGVALPVEAGKHTLTVLARGHEPREYALEIREGERSEILVEPGALLPERTTGVDDRPAPTPPSPPPAGEPQTLRTVAYVAGAAGLVGLAVGGTYGVLAMNAAGNAASHCDGDLCDPTGAAARRDEVTKAQVATIGLSAGAALLTTGAVLRVLTPSRDEERHVRRNLGYVVGAAGLTSAVVGTIFGLRAVADHRDASEGCSSGGCDAHAAAAQKDEGAATSTSAVALGAGALLLGAGIWLVASEPVQLSVSGAPAGAALRLGGAW
jgi:hypothetical protein